MNNTNKQTLAAKLRELYLEWGGVIAPELDEFFTNMDRNEREGGWSAVEDRWERFMNAIQHMADTDVAAEGAQAR